MFRRFSVLLALLPLACAKQAPPPAAADAPLVVDQRVGEPCASKADPVAAVICDAELRATDARERRDVVRLFCYDEKINRIRELAAIRGRAASQLAAEPAPPEGEAKHLRQLVAVTEERIGGAWNELDACVSEYPAPVDQPATRSFSPPGSAGTDPLPPEDP